MLQGVQALSPQQRFERLSAIKQKRASERTTRVPAQSSDQDAHVPKPISMMSMGLGDD